MNTKTVDLTPYRDLDIKSIEVRPMTGADTLVAAARCVTPGGEPVVPELFGLMLRQQMIAEAIVAVDGKKCHGPCIQSVDWNARTREFVGETYDYVNGLSNDEREAFRKALAGASGAQPGTTSTT